MARIAVSAALVLIVLYGFSCQPVYGAVKHFYLAAVDFEWDYAPSGRDLIFNHQSEANQRIETTRNRIGSKYSKVCYKEYTDSTYQREILKPSWQGYVGPILRAEVGDVMYVHFRNGASLQRNFSIHPHGLFYNKRNEGALYLDGESGLAKMDDGIAPGDSFTYIWNITDNFAPAKDDDNCVPYGYHSHVDSMMDIETGLVGMLLVCRRGTLGPNNQRIDVQKEFMFYLDQTDENLSHFANKNLNRCYNPSECRKLHERKNGAFQKSNRMYHINGYIYGNLPGFDVCEGQDIVIYMFALANELHTGQIHGQTMIVNKHRLDTVAIHPASFVSASMVPINPGSWLFVCRNSDHFHDGMTAFMNVHRCSPDPLPETPGRRLRRYYIAAEEVNWNYLPEGKDSFRWGKVSPDMMMDHGFTSSSHHHMHMSPANADALGNTYKKAVFVEYTDETFSTIKPRPPEEEHLQVLGPPIKVEVGDILEVVLLNKASRPYSIFPHGIGIDKSMEGSVYYIPDSDTPFGAITRPATARLYRFDVPWTAAPTADDPNCLTYMYHSAVDVRKDTNTGLVGPMLVCKPGSLDEQGKQIHVNKEFFVLFSIIDENLSWYIEDSILDFHPSKSGMDRNDESFKHGNLVHAINGRIYGNLEGLDMCLGDRVSWHFFSLGGSKDLHTVAFEGNAITVNGRTLDSDLVTPGLGFTGYMHPDNPGRWALFCHTHHHIMAGMVSTYNVNDHCPRPPSLPLAPINPSGVVRRYFIAAVEIEWDYAPSGVDKITGSNFGDPSKPSYVYTRDDGVYLGTTYKKAVYREFTDETFQHEVKRSYRDLHLGILGPFIRAEVGDVIEVVFMNNASKPLSVKPHGVFYDKQNEGMKYNDQSAKIDDNEVQPGVTYTYVWKVPERAGPGPNEPNCVGWMYHSATNIVRDIPTGLVGPLVTCRRGTLDAYNQRKDESRREFAIMFYIFNENRSWYIFDNMNRKKKGRGSPPADFEESNLMNSINGYIYGNIPGLVMETNELVTWYVLGIGSENDYHTVHFHGQTYVHRTAHSHRGDVVEVFPGTYETVDMLTDNPGTWLLHCHVTNHLEHGMEAKFAIVPKGALKPLEEADERHNSYKHNLPSAPDMLAADQQPVRQRPVGNIRRNLPILPKHLQGSSRPTLDLRDQRGSMRSSNSLLTTVLDSIRSRDPGMASARAVGVAEARASRMIDLMRTGILPGRWRTDIAPPNSVLK